MEETLTEDSEVVAKLLKDSMYNDIDALLVKLNSNGEESLLITANQSTIHILGSDTGKRFLSQDDGLAMRFHRFCFGGLNANKTEENVIKSELGVEKIPTNKDPDSTPDVSDVTKPKRKRGRPPKVAKIVEEDEDPPADLEEDDDITEEDLTANTDNSETEMECTVSRSGRKIKRKAFGSLGYVSLEKKKKKKVTHHNIAGDNTPSKSSPRVNARTSSKETKENEKNMEVEKNDEGEFEPTQVTADEQKTEGSQENLEDSTTEESSENQTTHKRRKGLHICKTCGETFKTQELIENHLRLNHPEVWAKILEEETDILVSLAKNDTQSESPKRKGRRKNLAEKKEEILLDCEKCEGKFKSTKMLEKHVKLMHSDELSNSNGDQEEGENSENLDGKETENSDEDYSESSNLNSRKRIKKVTKKIPGFDPLSVAMKVNEVTYKIHDTFVKGSEFKCYTCQDKFNDIALLIKHMRQTNHDGLERSAEEIKRTMITVSKKKKPTVYKCSHCRVEYFIKENCQQHVKENNCRPMWKRNCPMKDCDLIFDNNNFFMNHMETFHETTYPFFCAKCNRTYLRIREYESHCSYHRRIDNSQINPSLPIMCNECGLRFANNFELKQHKLDMHEADKKFKCEVCDRKFRREDNMKLHLKTHYKRQNDPELQCKVCQKYFSSKDSLKTHSKFMHTEEKPCVCEICGHTTRQMGTLQYHMKVKHSDNRPYACEWEGCNKTFKIYQVWQSHSQNHALAAGDVEKARSYGRLHHCKICLRFLPCRTDMNNHMLIHSTEKGIKCEICQTLLKRWGSLKRHMMNVHNKIITGGLSAMKVEDCVHPHIRQQKRMLSIRKPKTYPTGQAQARNQPIAVQNLMVRSGSESVELEETDYQTEATYELQNSDAQEKLLQILADASSDITKIEQAASLVVNPSAERDFESEANSQTNILEEVNECEIEETTTDEVSLDDAGEQVIYLNSLPNELLNAQDTGSVIYAIRNSDGSLSLQLAAENEAQ